MIEDCTAIILAGGESRRMGQDKANLPFGNRTLLQSAVDNLQPLFANIIVSVKQPRPDMSLPQVCDDPSHSGPLGGLAAGLENMETSWLFAMACDMPFITPAVIEYLAQQREDYQAVVPLVDDYPQPLAAFYAKSCLPLAQDCLSGEGKHSLRELLARLQVRYISEAELREANPQGMSFLDLDTPQEVAVALHRMENK